MLSREEHDGIVTRLYASAMGDRAWADTLAHVANRFSSSAAVIQVSDTAFNTIWTENHGYSRAFAEEYYASDVYANDPRVPHFRNIRPGSLYYDHCLYDVTEMDRDARCQQTFEVLGVKYQLGAVTTMPNGVIGALAVLSTDAEGHACEDAIESMRRLAPHVEQALSLGYVTAHQATTRTVLLDALASKADGVVTLGKSGEVSFMNDAARAIVAANDGLSLSAKTFVASRGPETRRLQGMIYDALAASKDSTARPGGQMLVTRPSGRRPLVLRAMPAPPSERFLTGESIACVIHIHDLAAVCLPSRESLNAIFGLTEREADLVIELVRCADLTAAAANAGMALNTARNHLQAIFRKSGVSSQTEAVQLFSRTF
jgi:DNA-binding CsgD family transcriptional regulator